MSIRTFRDVHDFRRRGPHAAVAEVKRFGGIGTAEVAERYKVVAIALTPVGGSLSKPRTSGRYGHQPGQMKHSWILTSVASTEGRAWALANKAPHSQIIGKYGRRRNKKPYRVRLSGRFFRSGGKTYVIPAKRRLLGSRQAPRGVVGPAYRIVKQEENSISRRAIEKAERAF